MRGRGRGSGIRNAGENEDTAGTSKDGTSEKTESRYTEDKTGNITIKLFTAILSNNHSTSYYYKMLYFQVYEKNLFQYNYEIFIFCSRDPDNAITGNVSA